ncbi:hypothetical protein SBRY_30220 [Actinacidiphila bryophytorum]|uniref:Uncharacterized protein n=1 Tax=Actinacidiphila bryophytorum TaxID=1436133 RepID=A0A9W4H0M1_9ACTN|nr:hypothetical protein SBRY_30220 [Actinacidiphila bryophytorum]
MPGGAGRESTATAIGRPSLVAMTATECGAAPAQRSLTAGSKRLTHPHPFGVTRWADRRQQV